MTLDDALRDVQIAFWQLEFAIKLLTHCELGHIEPTEFDTDHTVRLENEDLHFPPGHFSDSDNIVSAAGVSVLLAFAGTALALDKAFEVAGVNSVPTSTNQTEKLRALVYMVRCAYAHGVADPRWEVRRNYRTVIEVELSGRQIVIDLRELDGERFYFEQLGGHHNWFVIRDHAVAAIENCLPTDN